jgi:hypothetical protein
MEVRWIRLLNKIIGMIIKITKVKEDRKAKNLKAKIKIIKALSQWMKEIVFKAIIKCK